MEIELCNSSVIKATNNLHLFHLLHYLFLMIISTITRKMFVNFIILN